MNIKIVAKAITFVCLILLVSCRSSGDEQRFDPLSFVDPLIGSGGHGHVFVGANVPFGMVQLGPTNITQGWDWCSGYHGSDSTLIGYAHTHLSGTGIGDKGDILLMPYVGTIDSLRQGRYLSTYNKQDETAIAGYYSLVEQRYGVKAELTASERVGFHRYTYPGDSVRRLIVNLTRGIGWDAPTGYAFRTLDDYTVVGHRFSKGWAEDDRVYFAARFSAPIVGWRDSCDLILLDFGRGGELSAAVAISGVSEQGALKNLKAEGYRSFDEARREASQKWRDLLSSIEVKTSDTSRLRTFYTALYHASFFPCIFSDVDGHYRGADGKTHRADGFEPYTVFSLWDTYRAAHPLYTLYASSRAVDMVNSMLAIYDQQGKLPVWHLWGNETNCMTGFSSVQVVGDAVLKGLPGIDPQRAYRAMKAYASLNERGLKEIREKGYYPADKEAESVARAMEYSISDAAVARVALKLGYAQDAAYFKKRSEGYRRYFDPSDGFVKGVMSDGTFRTPFDPAHSTHRDDDFCEGNAWQYTWMVPHDLRGLFDLFESDQEVERKLDLTFSTPYVPSAEASPDISGMIGQVAHGNEPSHATPYLYAALGKPDKTARIVRYIMDSLYCDSPDGLSGNEDCGQMSAWYVLNAMGFYQVDPAGGEFVFGSPIFDRMSLRLPAGKVFTIITEGDAGRNPYIKSVTLDGKPFDRGSISYEQIMRGGQLVFTMGASNRE